MNASVLAILRRELAVERAGREALVTTAPYVAAFVVLAGLAFGPAPQQLESTAAGTIWLAVLVAAVPLSRSVATVEVAEDSWDVLRGLTTPGSLFAGKLLAVWASLVLSWSLASGLVVVLFEVQLPWAAVWAAFAGTLGLAAATTVLGVLVAAGTRRRGLLATLLLPAGLPALLAGTQLTMPGRPVLPWAVMMGLYAVVLVTATWAVFPALLEE